MSAEILHHDGPYFKKNFNRWRFSAAAAGEWK
jgi:hypothetical protein